MDHLSKELAEFIAAYEQATNSHDVEQVINLIHPEATYWFTDGSHSGSSEIRDALRKTFDRIQDETYRIKDVEWVFATHDHACMRYRFEWSGRINGEKRHGSGRGTNVVRRTTKAGGCCTNTSAYRGIDGRL